MGITWGLRKNIQEMGQFGVISELVGMAGNI